MAFRHEIQDFGAFYERTYAVAYRTALGICGEPALAADVTQDAYLAAYRERGRFRGEAPVGAWLQRIVVHAALSGLRRQKVRRAEPIDPARHEPHAPTGPDRLDALALRDALGLLAPKQRAAIVLRYYHDLDYGTIAQALDTSVGNVGSLLSRGIEQLRAELRQVESPLPAAVPAPREAGHGR